jgi:medium-chain acyl-[acyl-carrier-protein] hydrolase
MVQTIWSGSYRVNTIVLDHSKRLGLFGLLNLLQDAAWLHANHNGWGFDDLMAKGTIWVLVRQKLAMERWPQWEDEIAVRTWGRQPEGPLARREFEIVADGNKIGECTTSWLVVDYTTRRPQRLDREAFEAISRKEGLLTLEAGKIAPRRDLKTAASFEVRNSDLDVNGHVNNTRYAQWITDTMTADEIAATAVTEYEINFLSETGLGDTVAIEREEAVPAADGRLTRQYQGRRNGSDKPVFAAILSLRPR